MMRSFSRALIVFCTLLCCVGCDQVSKVAARDLLVPGALHSYLGDLLRLQLVDNPGSFLSLGAGLPAPARFWLFVGAVGLLLLALVLAALFARRLNARQALALAIVGGGGISNLMDRVVHDGRVTDFLNLGWGALRTGIFNVADMLILVGAALLMLVYRERGVPPRAGG
jgi:signal peptidase II